MGAQAVNSALQALQSWTLADPWALSLSVLALAPWLVTRRRDQLSWPTIDAFPARSWVRDLRLWRVPDGILSLAILAFAVALARPQKVGGTERLNSQGIAIEFALDRSSSMTGKPMSPGPETASRLASAIDTFDAFVAARPDDLIGLVTFAGSATRLCAPTLDHAFLREATRSIRPSGPGDAGTNIGHALALALGELRAVNSQRKVLVLLTDGRNEPPQDALSTPIAPEDVARLAPSFGVILYTIAIGAPDKEDGDRADVALLKTLAALGRGKFYEASEPADLLRAYHEIDSLERSSLVSIVRTRYLEGYPVWIGMGLALLLLSRVLASGPYRHQP